MNQNIYKISQSTIFFYQQIDHQLQTFWDTDVNGLGWVRLGDIPNPTQPIFNPYFWAG